MRRDYRLIGHASSFFTTRLRAVLEARRLPHRFEPKRPETRLEVESRAGTHRVPVLVFPEGWFAADGHAAVHHLERMHADRPLLPRTPVRAAACRVLEDWIDEWLIRIALHFRWCGDETEDRSATARRLVAEMWGERTTARQGEARFAATARSLERWGRAQAEALAAGAPDRGEIQLEYAQVLELLESHLASSAWLLGTEPCLADVALHALLETHLAVDAASSEILASRAPAVLAWIRERPPWSEIERLQSTTSSDDTVPIRLLPLLREVGRGHHVYLRENRLGLKNDARRVEVDPGMGRRPMVVRRYAERRRLAVSDAIAAEPSETRARIRSVLDPVGAWHVYELPSID